MSEPLEPDEAQPSPIEPLHRFIGPLNRFLHVEAASGVVLLACSTSNELWEASCFGGQATLRIP